MQKRNVLNSPRLSELEKERHKTLFKKAVLSAFGILIIFGGSAYVSHSSSLNIQGIEVVGNTVVDSEVIKASVEKKLTGNYLWLFPKTNVFFYPRNTIKKELGNEFKRLENISLSMADEKILKITVTERKPKYLWCEESDKCSFMDENGFIFDDAPYFSGEVYFKFHGPRDTNFAKFFSFKNIMENMKLKPVALYVEDAGDIKMFLSSASSSSKRPEILFDADADLEKIAENLQAALATEPLLSNFKNKYSALLYIDLRFGNKVYYKFK